ncbi:MAG: DUF6273 domain-containing protein [Oscillospiraceae bacterium]|jgi:hypothetical protein|nr:DUF6273 domain-containing protein [Oscillospiraceae bacterium]
METTKNRGLKKKTAAAVSVVLVIAIALGGTYMWNDFSQHKTNEVLNELPKYNVKLIEDFQEKTNWVTTDGALKKEIRVKNTGLTDGSYSNVYARIQLKEYMELAPMVMEKTPDRYMIDVSGDFIVFETEALAQAAYPDAPAVVELTDAVSGAHGWFIQTKEHDPNGQYGDFVTTRYELGDKTWVVGDQSMENARLDANKSEEHNTIANGEAPHRNGECDYPARVWENTDENFEDATNPTTQYIRWRLNNNDIILLSAWDGVSVSKWIIDDRDGLDTNAWIYWGRAIVPGATTANFMSAIELKVQPDGNFYYAIHAEMEALSLDELSGDTPRWTDAPEKIIDTFTGDIAPDAEVLDAQNYRLTTAQTGDTADWIAVAKKTVSGQDYYLIVRTEVTENSSFDGEPPYMNNYNSADCKLKTAIDSWYDTFTGANGSSVLVTKAVTHNALTALGEDYTHGFNAAYNGLSSPTATLAEGAAGTAFPLSNDEAAAYMSVFWYDTSANTKYNTSDRTTGGTAIVAHTNWEALADGTSVASWLRSPTASDSNSAALLYTDGSVDYYGVSLLYGVRPALWVTSDIFN